MPGPKPPTFFEKLKETLFGREEGRDDETLEADDNHKPADLNLKDSTKGPQQKQEKPLFSAADDDNVISVGVPKELDTNQELVGKTLMEELDSELSPEPIYQPGFKESLIGKIPNLRNIKPRPNFRYDDLNQKEKAKYVYEFEYEYGPNVYLHRDGSISCHIDPNKSQAEQDQDIILGVTRMLEVAASMGIRQGMLCMPPDANERLKEQLHQIMKNARENLGIEVFIGNPSIPMPPKQGAAPRPSPY